MRYSKCVRCASMVGWIGLFTNLVLLILKGFVGIISGSQALVADAMYSAKDVVSSILVIIGLKVSNQPLDREHPYGHGKIEFILSMVISVIFLVVTAFLFVHAIQILMNGDEHRAPHMITTPAVSPLRSTARWCAPCPITTMRMPPPRWR
jgi:cation diffusion facilitator family transporter